MSYQYDESMGEPQPAHMGSQSATGTQMAEADIVSLHPPGTFAKNTQIGDVVNSVANTLGVPPPKNIIKLPKVGPKGG